MEIREVQYQKMWHIKSENCRIHIDTPIFTKYTRVRETAMHKLENGSLFICTCIASTISGHD